MQLGKLWENYGIKKKFKKYFYFQTYVYWVILVFQSLTGQLKNKSKSTYLFEHEYNKTPNQLKLHFANATVLYQKSNLHNIFKHEIRR